MNFIEAEYLLRKFDIRYSTFNLYVADFYCHSHKLIIEVDGPIHDSKENQFYDLLRTSGFNEFNIDVIRFTNEEVTNNIEDAVLRIRDLKRPQETF